MNNDLKSNAEELLDVDHGNLVLPAGHGKTHLIAASCAVAQEREVPILVLTHTVAGVDALRLTLRKLSGTGRLVRITTIDSMARSLAKSFPSSGGVKSAPGEDDPAYWEKVRQIGVEAMRNPHVSGMLKRSYRKLLVDEYQDCNEVQHDFICALANSIATVRIGDPLQAVYDFDKDSDFSWLAATSDLHRFEIPGQPWRWINNQELGDFLSSARRTFESGGSLSLNNTPASVAWHPLEYDKFKGHCTSRLVQGESTLVLVRLPAQIRTNAQRLGGTFGAMEEIEGKVLLECASGVDQGGCQAAASLLMFGKKCFSGLPNTLTNKHKVFESGELPSYRSNTGSSACLDALVALTRDSSPATVRHACDEIEKAGKRLYGREAWNDFSRAIREWAADGTIDLRSAVRSVRNTSRGRGRIRGKRLVSTPMRVKGLECDHCIVIDDGQFTAEELYVAVTRPTKSLMVISSSPELRAEY